MNAYIMLDENTAVQIDSRQRDFLLETNSIYFCTEHSAHGHAIYHMQPERSWVEAQARLRNLEG